MGYVIPTCIVGGEVMMTDSPAPDLSVHSPADYEIVVHGTLDRSWSDELWGLDVKLQQRPDGAPTTVLAGRVEDQAALAGILSHLSVLRMTILSVKRIEV